MAIKTVGVCGAGAMGGGIAHQAAISGFNVVLYDLKQPFVDGAVERAASLMDKKIAKGKMDEDEKKAILGRITTTLDLNDMAGVDIVIEAVFEDLSVKQDLFAKLDGICGPETILATNTSSMSITSIASATKRRDKVAGMHFFNPVTVMALVEMVKGYATSDETISSIKSFAEALGKTAILAKKDTPGFIVNRLLFSLFTEAMKMEEEGVATPADIDTGLKLGLGHPMGPFQLMDEIGGLDLATSVLDYFYEETKDPKWAVPYGMRTRVRAGRLGKKTGAGWYDYE